MQQSKIAVLLRNHTGAINQKASLNLFSSLPGVWRTVPLGQQEKRFKISVLLTVFFLVKNLAVMTSIDIKIRCSRKIIKIT